ncbi:glucosamine-6-phosphate deaminase [Telmatocola sphagniphila]|uniref:Glucosamine-6-phosphate deaminase n=2 Tax=Telmatocola sphagniphila TaxID=1123043 RepID=A0A8E6EXE6_9BACT|nr:glucosamine-6-phosphate deaminase [Telmatocola sphagniphila]
MNPTVAPSTRMPTLIFPTSTDAARHVATLMAKMIRENNASGVPTVLGLATGSTPVGLYRELIRMHKEENLDFSRVVTFNLDEYFPMPKDDSHSYNRWMQETLFSHINIKPENVHIPDGTVKPGAVADHCERYEEAIRKAGGIDIQILGIGRTGHIGFNEPGSPKTARTRLVTLDPVTKRDAASGFFGEENVPQQAITMGTATILEARKVILMAFGEHKAPTVQKAVENPPSESIAASFLQEHSDSTFILDAAAASDLTLYRRPWEIGPVVWKPELIRQAVIWLSLKVHKGLLKLSDNDFREHHLYELLREHGPAENLGYRVFQDRFQTIINHPAGNDPKRTILVFSPHPDDDVISMGGTIIRLVEQGHKVHIAYMTNGNIAVFDHDALRFTDFVESFHRIFQLDQQNTSEVKKRVTEFLKNKKPGQPDTDDVLKIKALIRETEARAAALACGIPPEQLEFMDLRFYRTGTIAKNPIHPQDITDIVNLFERLKPYQIYVAGELSDPHGTHRLCAEAIYEAVRRVRAKKQDFDVWLYRGAWEEWEPHQIEMAVPLSSDVLDRKKEAIFRHQSQKDRAMFPGSADKREFWQRAEWRNTQTAQLYDQFGLPEYYAMEAFVRWKDA